VTRRLPRTSKTELERAWAERRCDIPLCGDGDVVAVLVCAHCDTQVSLCEHHYCVMLELEAQGRVGIDRSLLH
jgi:hypothetical protein